MIRVLLVDDHEIVRQGLRFVLEQEPDVEVVGECEDGDSAVTAIRRLQPDVVLLDLVMPGLDGLGVLRALAAGAGGPEPGGSSDPGAWGGPAVVVLTSYPAEDRAVEAVRSGALSYLSKTTAADRVVEAVRAAAGGGSLLDPAVAALLVRRMRGAAVGGPLEGLSRREREVLTALARGRSNREIARALSLSEETVKTYVSSILAKLHLQDRTQAAIFGLQQGVVALDDALDDR